MIDQYRNKILIGHVLERLAQLPDDSVDMCITSPPYWGLRDYETEHVIWDEPKDFDHEHKWVEDGAQPTKLGHGGITHDINEKVQRSKSSATFHCDYTEEYFTDYPEIGIRKPCTAWLGSLGLEPTPTMFVSHLVQIFLEVKRVLKPTGTLWINLGDTYAGSASKNTKGRAGFDGRSEVVNRGGASHKSLIGIPDRLKIALIDAGMLCRNEIIWYKPNAMPQSAKDRFTNDTEKIYLFAMQKKYYFEQQFEPHTDASVEDLLRRKRMEYYSEENSESKYAGKDTGLDGDKTGRTRDQFYGDLSKGRNKRTTWKEKKHTEGQYADGHSGHFNEDGSFRGDIEKGRNKRTTWKDDTKYKDTNYGSDGTSFRGHSGYKKADGTLMVNEKGRNKRTTWRDGENVEPAVLWEIQTRAMAEAHFAVFPEALVETPITAGCPTDVCTECSKPKIIQYDTDKINTRPGKNVLQGKSGTDENPNLSLHSSDLSKYRQQIVRSNFKYIAQCECGAEFKPGIVMDIFMGSGTTAVVARKLGRDYIGVELNLEYANIAASRIRAGGTKAKIPEGYTQTDVTKGL